MAGADRPSLALALVAAMTFIPAAQADHCTGEHYVTIHAVATHVYAMVDALLHHSSPSNEAWVYIETNGLDGLQRGGEDLLGRRDRCQTPLPDQAVVGVVAL